MRHLLQRKLNRLKHYDYSKSKNYFITICTKNQEEFFGDIYNGKMILNKYGEIIENQWLWLTKQYNYIECIEFIIMPNHIHGILIINHPLNTVFEYTEIENIAYR
jgi:putative transposase